MRVQLCLAVRYDLGTGSFRLAPLYCSSTPHLLLLVNLFFMSAYTTSFTNSPGDESKARAKKKEKPPELDLHDFRSAAGDNALKVSPCFGPLAFLFALRPEEAYRTEQYNRPLSNKWPLHSSLKGSPPLFHYYITVLQVM